MNSECIVCDDLTRELEETKARLAEVEAERDDVLRDYGDLESQYWTEVQAAEARLAEVEAKLEAVVLGACRDLTAAESRLAEVEAERDQWQEDARRFCQNADYWRERAAARGEGDRPAERVHGWFADRDPEDRNDMAWQPVLQLDGMCVSAEVWFSTEGECNAFIADNIIGQSWHPAAARGEGDR